MDGNRKDGLTGALAGKRRTTRKRKLRVSPQDGREVGLSQERANLQDGRISASIKTAVSQEVDGSWRPCRDIWGATSSSLTWQQ